MTKAESAMAHEKAEVVMLREKRRSETITLAIEPDTH